MTCINTDLNRIPVCYTNFKHMLSTAMMTFLNKSRSVQSITTGHAEDKTRHFSIKDEISLKRLKFVNNNSNSYFIFNVGS